MIYRFSACGHPNILATHKATLEFTRDSDLSLKGDCIVGVNADFDVSKIKQLIASSKNKKILITIKISGNIKEKITARLNPNFSSDIEFVIRKTDFISERTFAIKADKAAFDLSREFIGFLKEKTNKINVIVQTTS